MREEGVLTGGRVQDGRRVGRRDLERDRIDKTSTLPDWIMREKKIKEDIPIFGMTHRMKAATQ